MGYYDQIELLYGYKIPEEVAEGKKPKQNEVTTLEEVPLEDAEPSGNGQVEGFRNRWKIPYGLDVSWTGDCRTEQLPGAIGISISKFEKNTRDTVWVEDTKVENFDKKSLDAEIAPFLDKISEITGINTKDTLPRIIMCYRVN